MAAIAIQSVKFKKDFMMLFAFLLFFSIVAFELFLVVWLPWHLKLDSMWADQVARQELIDHFDYVRGISRYSAERAAKPGNAEAALICRSLDRAAAYMHQYGKKMTPAQCRIFMDVIKRLHAQHGTIANGECYSRTLELSTGPYLEKLRGVKVAPPAKK